jgi:hypothetical protein
MPFPRLSLVAVTLVLSAAAPAAGAVGSHPHYLEALTDLRLAHALLQAPDRAKAEKFEKTAIDDVDQALAEIKHAAIDDGKNLDDHPPIDANVSHQDRLNQILKLVQAANRDLNFDEDDQKALGWRARAVKDAADAQAFVEAAISNDKPQGNQRGG